MMQERQCFSLQLTRVFNVAVFVSIMSVSAGLPAQALTPVEARALEMYRAVIVMRTAAGYGRVPEMAEYLAGRLRSAGFADEDIHVLPRGDTAALVVRYRGDGSSGRKPILFLGHMDVVDAEPSDWQYPPFELQTEDGYLHGRGTADNKYGVINLTQAFMRLKTEGFVPTRDLVLAFSGDEEVGGDETTAWLANERRDLIDAEYALNSDVGGGTLAEDGRPLSFGIQAAEKTYATFRVTARNPGGHSAAPRSDNAIYDLAEALLKIRAHEFPVQSNAILRQSLRAEGEQLGGELGDALVTFANDPGDADAIRVIRGNEEYNHVISTTCVATMLEAGQVENALPQRATATVNCRIFPGGGIADVQATLARVIDNQDLSITPAGEYFAAPPSPLREDVTAAIARAVQARYPGVPLVPYMSSGFTDGLHFRAAGIPVYGAKALFTRAGETNAHGVDERVPLEAFLGGLDHWLIIMRELAGP